MYMVSVLGVLGLGYAFEVGFYNVLWGIEDHKK
jgi:hypothetical protein